MKKNAMIMLLAAVMMLATIAGAMAAAGPVWVQQCNPTGIYAGQCRNVYPAANLASANSLVARLNSLPAYALNGVYFKVA